ncbi:hypothetical protein [Carnobacterium jeotgali]|uniref:hypothetical protein n=1 Tax=Carnobacterium jeotgali TaxID=545534 RepID=UPI000492F878|nr:hypothetical protein [Carnobacterium jeotgali]
MLKTTKSITLNGNSEIDGQPVVNLSATIPDSTGVGNISQYIQNAELYEKNKAAVRKDIADFQAAVYEVEDEIATENLT